MIVWIVEHRQYVNDFMDTTMVGIFSTKELAMKMVKDDLDALMNEKSWYCVYDQEIDNVVPTISTLISIDRLGHISDTHQPTMEPHLLTEWIAQL